MDLGLSRARFARIAGVTLFFVGVFGGCGTVPPAPPIPHREQLKADSKVGERIYPYYEETIEISKDSETTIYLRTVGLRLLEAVPDLKTAPLGIMVVNDRSGRPRNFSLPGNRVYLAKPRLKRLKFESEIASAIAIELAHLNLRHRTKQIEMAAHPHAEKNPADAQPTEWAVNATRDEVLAVLGPMGEFGLTENEWKEAIGEAVRILYDSGYDPRGMVTYLEGVQKNPGDADLPQGWIAAGIQTAREVINQHPPLRNPVVQTSEFIVIQKRLKKL